MSKRQPAHTPPEQAEPDTRRTGQQSPPGGRPNAPNDLPAPHDQNAAAARAEGDGANAGPKRAGTDTRHRGWYWHWNGIVTQYAPLIGLKGVGLLNSYTVWTDRREQSATRGYAFPSQQSESDFYGEDRSELITINKILVALDLIEIRKEMVLRTDPQGRRWKVPHNLYRVKDRPEGVELRTADVLRVAELASRDAAVFRYLKRIFSARFAPIDRDNVWHRILAEVASDPVWQSLTDKTLKIEARASARTRAGHKARTRQVEPSAPLAGIEESHSPTGDPNTGSTRATGDEMTSGQSGDAVFGDSERGQFGTPAADTSVAGANHGLTAQESDVAASNTGLATDVDTINSGLKGGDTSSAEAANTGRPSVVAPSNATYHQETSTTTTTTTGAMADDRNTQAHPSRAELEEHATTVPGSAPVTERSETDGASNAGQAGLDDNATAVPAVERSGAERESGAAPERNLADPGAGGPLVDPGALVVSLFEAANDRRASPLERILLAELERDADPAARAHNERGTDWVAAALREAVSSGSAFVAPKRVREIINRWAATGNRPQLDPPQSSRDKGSKNDAPHLARADTVRLPLRRNAARVWQAVLDDLARVLDASSHARLFAASRIVGYQRGTVVVQVNAAATEKLASEYRPLIERQLARHIGKPVTVEFVAAEDEASPAATPHADPIVISGSDAEQGRQLWRAVLSEIAPLISVDDLARLRGAMPLGQDGEGHIVIGAPTSLAARLIDSRCRAPIESALRTLLGDCVSIRIAGSDEWSISDERSER